MPTWRSLNRCKMLEIASSRFPKTGHSDCWKEHEIKVRSHKHALTPPQTHSLKGSMPTAISTAHHCNTKTAASPKSRFARDSFQVFLARMIVSSIPIGSIIVPAASKTLAKVKSPRAMND